MSDLESQVVLFVAEHVGTRASRLNRAASLFHDLGVDGADGWELLEEFSERFNVDMTGLDLGRHFGPEGGCSPFTLILWLFSPSLRRGDQMAPIRIGDLVQAAAAGRWDVLTL